MQHAWTKEGIIHNFCLNCGIRKSVASGQKISCIYHKNQDPLTHDVQLNKSQQQQCTKCEIIANQYYNTPHTTCCYDGYTFVVPYIEIFNQRNEVIRRRFIYGTERNIRRKEGQGHEVMFWPIYCAYTEDDVIIRDIII